MTRRSERDFLAADLAAVNNLLADLTAADVLSRYSLESRRDEIAQELSSLAEMPAIKRAEVSLFFTGRPVDANKGIAADFSAQVLAAYQDSVKKVSAFQRFGTLGDRGVVPGSDQSSLYITDVVRGSFGFQLEEADKQLEMEDSILKKAVDESTKLLMAFSSADEDEYSAGVQQVDQRVVDSISVFFNLLKENDATVRVVSDEIDKWISKHSIEIALERAKSIHIEVNDEVPIGGLLIGVLPTSFKFEFRNDRGETISGLIGRELVEANVQELQKVWLYKDCIAIFQVRSVGRPGREPRLYYTLLRIESRASGTADNARFIPSGD
jgi:hypothetical protein